LPQSVTEPDLRGRLQGRRTRRYARDWLKVDPDSDRADLEVLRGWRNFRPTVPAG
jgi:hypothetical protein